MGRINPLIVSLALLLMLAAAFVFPINTFFPGAMALAEDEESELSLVFGDDVELHLLPGVFSSGSQSIAVSTSNSTGYTLTIETLGVSSAMENEEIKGATIPTLTGEAVRLSDGFPYSYGYSLDGELFAAMPEPDAGEIFWQ